MITLQEAQEIVSQHEGSQVTVTSAIEVGNIGFRCVLVSRHESIKIN